MHYGFIIVPLASNYIHYTVHVLNIFIADLFITVTFHRVKVIIKGCCNSEHAIERGIIIFRIHILLHDALLTHPSHFGMLLPHIEHYNITFYIAILLPEFSQYIPAPI